MPNAIMPPKKNLHSFELFSTHCVVFEVKVGQ